MSKEGSTRETGRSDRKLAGLVLARCMWILLTLLLLSSVSIALIGFEMGKTRRQREVAERMQNAGLKILDESGANSLPYIYLPLPPACNADVVEAHVSKDEGLEYVKAFPQLRCLVVSGDVTDSGMARLTDVAGLTRLTLRDSRVTDAGLQNLHHMQELQELMISGVAVSDAGYRNLERLVGLRVLGLHVREISDAGLVHLKRLTSLHTLLITGSVIVGARLEQLGELPMLTTLCLEDSVLTDSSLCGLRNLSRLRCLSLRRSTPVTDDDVAHLDALWELEELDLSGTQITDAALEHLTGLTRLKHLYLCDTQVTEKAIDELRGSYSAAGIQIHR